MSDNMQKLGQVSRNGIDPEPLTASRHEGITSSGRITEEAKQQAEVLRETIAEHVDAANEQVSKAEQSVRNGSDAIIKAVRRNPTVALGGALGIGLLLGLAMSRGR